MLHFAGEQRGGPVQPGAAHPGRARRHRPQHLPRPPRLGRPQGPPAHGQQQRQPQEVHPGQGTELEITGHDSHSEIDFSMHCYANWPLLRRYIDTLMVVMRDTHAVTDKVYTQYVL